MQIKKLPISSTIKSPKLSTKIIQFRILNKLLITLLVTFSILNSCELEKADKNNNHKVEDNNINNKNNETSEEPQINTEELTEVSPSETAQTEDITNITNEAPIQHSALETINEPHAQKTHTQNQEYTKLKGSELETLLKDNDNKNLITLCKGYTIAPQSLTEHSETLIKYPNEALETLINNLPDNSVKHGSLTYILKCINYNQKIKNLIATKLKTISPKDWPGIIRYTHKEYKSALTEEEIQLLINKTDFSSTSEEKKIELQNEINTILKSNKYDITILIPNQNE